MNCVILQPSYIPWRGYFHQIYKADLFIYYDDAKYDKNGWRNRNRIKTPQGLKWLTIPIHTRGIESNKTPINQVEISWVKDWVRSHLETLRMAYHKAPAFHHFTDLLDHFFQKRPNLLADFTIETTTQLARAIGMTHTKFLRTSELPGIEGVKTERLINILKAVGATHYISGPSAQDYIDTELFSQAGITLEYMTYNYPVYEQLYPPYEPAVSILDLMFMQGPDTLNCIIQNS